MRVHAWIGFAPSIMYAGDSWAYVRMAWGTSGLGTAPDRPSGYPLAVKLLTLGQPEPIVVTLLQHGAGLVLGVVCYAILIRLGARRAVAAVVAGLVLLNAPAIVLEQHLMPEALFTLSLTTAAALTAWRPRDLRSIAAAGVLMAVALSMRTVGLFAVPVWAVCLLLARPGWRPVVVAAIAVSVPTLLYASFYQRQQGSFGLTATSGAFLYARVGEIMECEGLRLDPEASRLCRATERVRGRGVGYFLYAGDSPLKRTYGFGYAAERAERDRRDALLGGLGRAVIRRHPGRYAEMVALDFGRFFVPGIGALGGSDEAVTFPVRPRVPNPGYETLTRDAVVPDYRPVVRPAGSVARRYAEIVRVPRPLLAIAGLLTLLAVVAFPVRRMRRRLLHHRAALLFGGMGLVLLAMAAATSEFLLRYLVPSVPLLLVAGAVVLVDLFPSRLAAAGESTPAGAREA